MIVFDLECREGGHRFEGWFGSSKDFAGQQERGLVSCPQCGSSDVTKAPMAPNLARKGNQRGEVAITVPGAPPALENTVPAMAAPPEPPMMPVPPQIRAALRKVAEMQAEALKQSRWVGGKFANDVRAMHYGDREVEAIHGEASPQEARALIEEGIEVAPILFPVAPPDKLN